MLFYLSMLFLIGFSAFGADGAKPGDLLPVEHEALLVALSNTVKSGDLVVVQNSGSWRYAKFFERFGEGEDAQVGILNEKAHGHLVPAKDLRSISKKSD